MKNAKKIIALLIATPTLAWSHGEDKPGPHGGHIKMPGAFHTELILGEDQSAHIYLLDMNFKNATTKDSKLKVIARANKTEVPFNCSVMKDHFHCVPTKKYEKTSEIAIQAVREKAIGNEAVYKLPLATYQTMESKKSESHHSHH